MVNSSFAAVVVRVYVGEKETEWMKLRRESESVKLSESVRPSPTKESRESKSRK